SRQDNCAKGTTSFDCGSIKYEPQSDEAPKGSYPLDRRERRTPSARPRSHRHAHEHRGHA
ncbi:hypothetical protein AB0O43_00005, partial [Cellulosimicrobium funkei]